MRWMVPERKLDENQLNALWECRNFTGGNLWIQGWDAAERPDALAILAVHTARHLAMLNPTSPKICFAGPSPVLQKWWTSAAVDRNEFSSNKVDVLTYRQILDQVIIHDMVFAYDVFSLTRAELAQLNGSCRRLVFTAAEEYNLSDHGVTADDIIEILRPRPHLLSVTHRLTKKIMDLARTILPTSQLETVSTGRMQEVQVTLAEADSEGEEMEWVWSQSRRYAEPGDPAAVLLPSHRIVQEFITQVCKLEGTEAPDFPERQRLGGTGYGPVNEWLADAGIPLRYLGGGYGDLRESDEQALIYVMTYHSAKGLDFETVFLPFLNDGQSFWWKDKDIDRRLFFVGVTRSRRNLFLSYSSARPHEYVRGMPQALLHRERCEVQKEAEDDQEFIF